MVGAAVQDFGVEVGSGVVHEAAEEIFGEFRLQVAYQAYFDAILVDESGAAAEIDSYDREGLVHGKHEVAGAVDAFAITQRLGE